MRQPRLAAMSRRMRSSARSSCSTLFLPRARVRHGWPAGARQRGHLISRIALGGSARAGSQPNAAQ